MTKIELIQDSANAFECYMSFVGGIVKYEPVYFELNGKTCFVVNKRISPENEARQSAEEIESYRRQLEANDGRYFCFYGNPDVLGFLERVKAKGYTFERFTGFRICDGQYGTFYEFHGNLRESSYAFLYRIYDRQLFDQLREQLPKIKLENKTL